MNVVIRADASHLMGTGHLVRCLTLARELRTRGTLVRFITRAHSGHLIARLTAESFPVTVLPPPVAISPAGTDSYAGWRGVTVDQDATETIATLRDTRPDWLVVDHYGLDVTWERTLRPHVGRLMAIDDLPDRAHDCDLLLNQNLGATHGAVPAACVTLLGPHFALLRPDYSEHRRRLMPRTGKVRRVIIFFGGVDAENLTGATLQVLTTPEFAALEVDVVVGASNPHRPELEELVSRRPFTHLHAPQAHLADLMASADLAIGAGGGTTWERMCLGVPALLVAVSENQLTACRSLATADLAEYLGTLADWRPEVLGAALRRLLTDPARVRMMAAAGKQLVDGMGVRRVAERLDPTSAARWQVRPDMSGPEPLPGLPPAFVLEAAGLECGRLVLAAEGANTRVLFSMDESTSRPGMAEKLLVSALAQWRAARPEGANDGVDWRLPPLCGRDGKSATGLRLALLSDAGSWLNEHLGTLVLGWLTEGHEVEWVHQPADLSGGDLCFFLSCSHLVPAAIRARYRHNLVVHESAVPHGKGWSPLTWQVLEGRHEIPVTLLEATGRVDSGTIYDQQAIKLNGTELVAELRDLQARATLELCRRFVTRWPGQAGQEQKGPESFYPRRQAADSRLDPARAVVDQFDLLRVVDNERYPAYFEHRGRKYRLAISAA